MSDILNADARRFGVRRRTFKKGRILLDGMNTMTSCQIKDISKHGAMLKLQAGFECPEYFVLNIPDGVEEGDSYDCQRVSWRDNNTVGVQFISKHIKAKPSYELEKKVVQTNDEVIKSIKKTAGLKSDDQPKTTDEPSPQSEIGYSQAPEFKADSLFYMLEVLANFEPEQIADKMFTEIHNYPDSTLAITRDCQKATLNLMAALLELTEKTAKHDQ